MNILTIAEAKRLVPSDAQLARHSRDMWLLLRATKTLLLSHAGAGALAVLLAMIDETLDAINDPPARTPNGPQATHT